MASSFALKNSRRGISTSLMRAVGCDGSPKYLLASANFAFLVAICSLWVCGGGGIRRRSGSSSLIGFLTVAGAMKSDTSESGVLTLELIFSRVSVVMGGVSTVICSWGVAGTGSIGWLSAVTWVSGAKGWTSGSGFSCCTTVGG